MSQRVISARSRGFLFLDSHPSGCSRLVEAMWSAVPSPDHAPGPDAPVALIIGSSSGYGSAATIAGLARHGIRGIGVGFDKAPDRRTGTAGWYRTAATARLASAHGRDFVFLNGDVFSDPMKDTVARITRERFGGRIDYLIYSVAAPRRADPDTGAHYTSVIKPMGAPHQTKSLVFDDEARAEVKSVEVQAAEGEEVAHTVSVMGGDDWRRWIYRLHVDGLLAEGFTTVALSYIGSPLTAAIYWDGTIGTAKLHLEHAARARRPRCQTHRRQGADLSQRSGSHAVLDCHPRH